MGTRLGEITFQVPQVREGNFYPNSLEKGLCSKRALKLALAEMYVQGVSTRKVAKITEQLCGFEVSSTQVSQAAAELDEQMEAWRGRPLGQSRYLWLDAHYKKVWQDGQMRDAAVLKAVGPNDEGKRMILGVSISLSEHEVRWRSRVAVLFPYVASCEPLVIAVLMEISEEWETGRTYRCVEDYKATA